MQSRVRYIDFLKDVFLLSVSCFGGPQAHIAHFQKLLVEKRKYITEEELIEVNALGQVLPGPTSTQTLTAIAYRLRGPNLAYLTLIIWMLPSVAIMTALAILMASFETKQVSMAFTRFIQPMAVGFVAYGAYSIGIKTVTRFRAFVLMVLAAVASYFVKTPFVFPVILVVAGCITAFNYKAHPREPKKKFNVVWSNLILWVSVLVFAALLGSLTKTKPEYLPIRLFENFYRNGSLVFGGGQVLTPMLYTEFVQYAPKQYLTPEEFLSGYAVVQALPGPVFSFSSFIGALSMREFGTSGEIFGAIMSAAGVFLPGTFLIFFMIRVWDSLKSFRAIRASLEGILAANSGLVAAAAILLFQPLIENQPLENILLYSLFTVVTFCLIAFTKIPSWAIIAAGLLMGFVL
ncbi:MAG TPA: chromate efflux transporter [Cyclobacteriaceae bacterium]|nr:chromate efflux transporter [Cyclobacteriaceae bacterium]